MATTRKKKTGVDGRFNLTTALVLLIMLLVVVIALLTNMLYEEKQNLVKLGEDKIYCIPVAAPTATPVMPVPTISVVPLQNE